MSDCRIARWYDHAGHIYEAPWVEGRQTTTRYNITHYVFGKQSESPVMQAITLCGKRAGLIPGDEDVDCPECLDALAEDESPGPSSSSSLSSSRPPSQPPPTACTPWR